MRSWLSRSRLSVFAYRGKHVKKSPATAAVAIFSSLAILLSSSALLVIQPANAGSIAESFQLTGSPDGFGLYLDAPRVQGSYLTGTANSSSEDFNGSVGASCPTSIAGGALSGSCQIYSGPEVQNFGASSTSGLENFGGAGTKFASTVVNTASPLTLSFSTPQKYLGFFWSSGSPGNQIDFYQDDVLLSSITTEDLMTVLGADPSGTTPSAEELTAINGTKYKKNFYFGNSNFYDPVTGHENTLWGLAAPLDPYVYIHAFAAGNVSFNKVILSGNYFEFDNLVTSSASGLEPNSNVVPYKFFDKRRVVRFDKNNAAAVGAMSPQTGLTPTNLNVRGFGLAGFDFLGWNTAADGSGTSYADSALYSFANDVTLYAQWQTKTNKPAIFGLGVRVDEIAHSYSRPDVAHGLAIDWQGLSPVAGDESWYLCDSPHTNASDYFLSSFPADCTQYPYGAMVGGAGNATFPLSLLANGKYVGYGMWAQNSAGATYALQTSVNPFNLAIQGLAANGDLKRTAYTVTGYPTSQTGEWYRCDNPFVSSTVMPSGTCTATGSTGQTYVPGSADFGKNLVFKATATVSGTNVTVTQITNGGPTVAIGSMVNTVFADFTVSLNNTNTQANISAIPAHPDITQTGGAWLLCRDAASGYVFDTTLSVTTLLLQLLITNAGCSPLMLPQMQTYAPVVSGEEGKHLLYFYEGQVSNNAGKALIIYRSALVPVPAPPASQGGGGGAAAPSNNLPTPSASPTPEKTQTPIIPPAKPNPKPIAEPSGSSVTSQLTNTSKTSVIQPKVVYESGVTETQDEVVLPPVYEEKPIVKSIQDAPKSVLDSFFKPVKNTNIGALGVDGLAPKDFFALESPEAAKSFTQNLSQLFALLAGLTLAGVATARASRRKSAVPDGLDAGRDPFAAAQKRWGDLLPVWKLGIARIFDGPSVWWTLKTARVSPLLSKIINDASYLRAMFGSLTIVAPLAAAVLAISAVNQSNGLIANQAWTILLLLSWISIFDALAGLVAIATYVTYFWIVAQHIDVWQDIRILLGTAVVILGPSLLMTAFRAIRRAASSHAHEWWERFADLAIGPFISGWSVSIFVSALPAIAGMTLSVANHVLLFSVIIALSSFVRVLAEEFAAQNYPHRMDKLTPDEIPDSSMAQKYISLTVRYLFWVFMAASVLGNTWQLWLGSLVVVIPQVISWCQDGIPNSPVVWRLLPTGIPGLAFGLLVTGWTTTALSYLVISSAHLAKWAFVILPMPIVIFALLASFGRFGETHFEVKPSKRNKYVYRIGGVVMLAITMRLAGIY